MGVLERKLVRFLLGASVDDEDFARVLNGALGEWRKPGMIGPLPS